LALAATVEMVRGHGWARAATAFARARLDTFRTPWLPDSEYSDLTIVLAASVELLPERERVCFEACAVWPEDAVIPEAVLPLCWSDCGVDEFDGPEVAGNLVAASVLRQAGTDSEPSYRLHDLYHDYLTYRLGDAIGTRHHAVAERCVALRDTMELKRTDPWVLHHLIWHLVQAGAREQALDLFFDLSWLETKLAKSGLLSISADASVLDDHEAAWLVRVLRLSTRALAEHPTHVRAQLLARLAPDDGPQVARLLTQCHGARAEGDLVPDICPHLRGPGPLMQTYSDHAGPVWGALLVPDGRALSWSDDGTLRLWDLDSGASRELAGHEHGVLGALLMPDGRALSWSRDGTVRVWDRLQDPQIAVYYDDYAVTWAMLDHTGKRLLIGTSDGQVQRIRLDADLS